MTKEELSELYAKEREYQKQIFGNYSENPELNLASFLHFIEEYLNKAKKYYVKKWDRDLPPWLDACREEADQGAPAPIKTYEELIKVFALTGAVLETYTQIDVEKWREKKEIDNE